MAYVLKQTKADGTTAYFNGMALPLMDALVRIFDMNDAPLKFLAQRGAQCWAAMCPTTARETEATVMSRHVAEVNAAYLAEAGLDVTVQRESHPWHRRLHRVLG